MKRDPRQEWVLDYIVERKGVADLLGSIKSGRYEQQKFWMKRCGLLHLMYLVEGKPEDLAEGEPCASPDRRKSISKHSCIERCNPVNA